MDGTAVFVGQERREKLLDLKLLAFANEYVFIPKPTHHSHPIRSYPRGDDWAFLMSQL